MIYPVTSSYKIGHFCVLYLRKVCIAFFSSVSACCLSRVSEAMHVECKPLSIDCAENVDPARGIWAINACTFDISVGKYVSLVNQRFQPGIKIKWLWLLNAQAILCDIVPFRIMEQSKMSVRMSNFKLKWVFEVQYRNKSILMIEFNHL